MKLRLFIFGLFFILSAGSLFANVVPQTSEDIPSNTIGLYQTDERIVVYEKPDKSSKMLSDKQINYSMMLGAKFDNMFAVLIPEKNLGYLYVTDTSDDENWVLVIYDKSKNLKGWAYKRDEFQFFPWINFYDMYGRKYGLSRFKNSKVNEIHSQPDENSQIIGEMTVPKQIKLTSIEGNWALVTAVDTGYSANTGYVQWRDSAGRFYMFPAMK